MKECLFCSKELSGYQTKFCSLSCAGKYSGPRRPKKVYPLRNCLTCGTQFQLSRETGKDKKFCNQSCAATFNNVLTTVYKFCPNCGIKYMGDGKYCSRACSLDFLKKTHIEKWLSGEIDGSCGFGTSSAIRRWLFEKYDSKCAECGWSKINPTSNKIPLECHHIDGNHKNNTPENLILLCPNCHSLTPNHRALNKGKGREGRRKSRWVS